MKIVTRWVGAVIALGVLPGLAAGEEERAIDRSEVPKAVMEVVQKSFPAAQMIGFERDIENGKTTYEVRLQEGARRMDVGVAPEGHLLEVEEDIRPDRLPAAVRRAIASSEYSTLEIKRAEKQVSYANDRAALPVYEIALAGQGKRVSLVVNDEGKITKRRELAGKKKE